ncbi:hypothetical protein [Nocardia aurantiaca]|uniref:Uncharacterized protein n=1 Tax=Nocardia aurantiaca TaxID=2675850 RepID=A0A6I3LCC5_9NOCA|nr:hypothetical protein [Nocardia aurantiaca]MTE17489.1 hypothetical protein [Nocardia aurantiaca]
MPSDDPDAIEIQVIQDVLDTVEARLREQERCGLRLTVPRSRIFAVVLHAVISSARESYGCRATLDRAGILDAIFDGVEPTNAANATHPVDHAIRHHSVNTN